MATLLADSGFAIEALPPLGEAAAFAMRGLAVVVVPNLEPEAAGGIPETELCELEAVRAYLPPGSVAHLASIKANGATDIDASRTAAQTLPRSVPVFPNPTPAFRNRCPSTSASSHRSYRQSASDPVVI